MDSALALDGTLYRAVITQDALAIAIARPEDETSSTLAIPGTEGHSITTPLVAVDSNTSTLVVVWQEQDPYGGSEIIAATYSSEQWFGPVTIAGSSAVPARNPSFLLYHEELQAEGAPPDERTFLICAWWEGDGSSAHDTAAIGAIPLDASGTLLMEEEQVENLASGYGYGIVCEVATRWEELARPKLLVEPRTGLPMVLSADLSTCLFRVDSLALTPDPNDDGDLVTGQRRRTIVVLNKREEVAIPLSLDLRRASLGIGKNLSVVAYWDEDDGVSYITSVDSEWSDVRRLAVDDQMPHEKAVRLIQDLVRQ